MSSLERARVTDTEDIEAGLRDIQESVLEADSGNNIDITSLNAPERQRYAEIMIKNYREPIRRINEWTVSLLNAYDAAVYDLDHNQKNMTSTKEQECWQDEHHDALHEPPGAYTQKQGLGKKLGEDIWAEMIGYGFSSEAATQHEGDTAYRELIAWDYFQRVISLVAVRNGVLAAHIGYYKSRADMEIQNVAQEYRVLETCWQQARFENTNRDFPVFVLKIMGCIIDNARAIQDTIKLQGQE